MSDLNYIAEPLRALAVPIGSLNLDPANARTHDERNLGAIRGSLARFGQRLPVVVQREGMVVRAGNGRLLVARELGWSHIAAVVVDESTVEATAFAIADNRSAELAAWNDEALAALLESLPKDVLPATGFTDEDLAALLRDVSGDDDKSAEPQLGDGVYQVVVECDSEQSQSELIERLEEEGYKCRALML